MTWLFMACVPLQITFAWDPPTQNTDGSEITDLAGYYFYAGVTPGAYRKVDEVSGTTYSYGPGMDRFFVVTAVDTSGNESEYSNMVELPVPICPCIEVM